MIYYCPLCAAKIAYEAVRPTACPKCRKSFASAFVAPKPAPTVVYVVKEPEDEPLPPRCRPSLAARRANSGIVYRDEEGNLEEIDTTEEDGDYADPREVRRRARQLSASLKFNIRADYPDEDTVKLGDWVNKPSPNP